MAKVSFVGPGLRLAQPEAPEDQVSVLLSPEDGSRTSVQNFTVFLNT
jgi:hypothetical protein